MADFLSKALTTPTSGDMASRKEALMNTVRQEVALANAQELMNKASERCFTKCVMKPGDSLSNSEQTCLARCLDRYMEACGCATYGPIKYTNGLLGVNIVSRTYVARVSRERLEGQQTVTFQESL